MDKPTKLLRQSDQRQGQPQPKPTDPPTEPADPSPTLTYRILCNSEHFLVINPVQRKKPQLPYRPDAPHADPASTSSRFQAKLDAAREKGRILRPRQ